MTSISGIVKLGNFLKLGECAKITTNTNNSKEIFSHLALNIDKIVDIVPRGMHDGVPKGAIFTTTLGEKIFCPPTIDKLESATAFKDIVGILENQVNSLFRYCK